MSEIKVNSIKGTGASSAAITVHTSDGTATGKFTNLSGRNIVINGSMAVAQRGTTSTTSGCNSVDRWQNQHGNTDEAPTQAQIALTSSDTGPWEKGFRYALQTTNGNQTSAGAGDYIESHYRVEAQDMANSGWNYNSASSKITLSFWVKSSVGQTFYGFLYTADSTAQQYPFSLGSLSANTWTKVTKTIPGHANITINNDNGEGLRIAIVPFYGTTYTSSGVTLDAWSAYGSGTDCCPDNTSTWYTSNDATFAITGVQLEVGDVATDFEHRSYHDELHRCMRYYQAFPSGDRSDNYTPVVNSLLLPYNTTECYWLPDFRPVLRSTPTISYTGNFRLNATGLQQSVTSSAVFHNGSNAAFCKVACASGLTAQSPVALSADNDATARFKFDAEL